MRSEEPPPAPDVRPELVAVRDDAPRKLPVANASWRRPRAPAAAPAVALPRSLLVVGPDVPPPPPAVAPQESEDYLDRVQREARERLPAGTAPARA